jgi:hypothetical protein
MELNLPTIRAKFDAILATTITRESASDWARELREASDRNELTISPSEEKRRLWKALLFLEGVDMKDAPNSYLHNEEDITRERP